MELKELYREKLYKRIQELFDDEIEDHEDYEVYLEENKEFLFEELENGYLDNI